MTDSPFRGVIPPVVIPLTEKKQLDLEAFERSINRMIDAGVDGLFFLAPRARSRSSPMPSVTMCCRRPWPS